MKDFDFQTADLGKATLIEASAGTGKTYVLERLLERLLTEPWKPEPEGPISLPGILVVTFTEKATQELRERIRAHLKLKACDPHLSELKRRFLNKALLECESASIHTIHGFCRNLLGEFSLDCGADFESIVGGEEVLSSLIQDGFRKWENTAHIAPLKAFLNDFKDIKAAEKFILKLLRSDAAEAICEVSSKTWTRCEPERSQVLKTLSEEFLTDVSLRVKTTFEALKKSPFNKEDFARGFLQSELPKKKFNKNVVANALNALSEFDGSDTLPQILALQKKLAPFSKESILERAGTSFLQKGGALWLEWIQEVSEFVKACDTLNEAQLSRELALRCDFLFCFISQVLFDFQKYKAEEHRLTYEDMIGKVHHAVVFQKRFDLLQKIRSRYQAVLLDEFQDTDRRQWEIFETLFFHHSSPGPFFLVGDPKQAIYRFRGADLPVYFNAKRALNHSFPLSVNYRSYPPLLEGLNRLFLLGPLFPETQSIRFLASSAPANSCAVPLFEDGKESSPIEFISLPPNSVGANRTLLYSHIAETLVRFLKPDSHARLGGQKIRPKDAALLTHTNRECLEAADILRQYGIPCVIASPESLWQTREVSDLEIFLRAVANPAEEDAVLRCLLTFFFDLDPQEILNFTDKQKESYREQFWKWAQLFNETRLSLALVKVWNELNLFPRQLSKEDGLRLVTRLQHLLEKIIEQENDLPLSPEAWCERLANLRKQEEEKEPLRLETDQDAVPILTIHKSKGLEFPIVFLAGGTYKKHIAYQSELCHYSEQDLKVFDLCSSKEGRSKAALEQESELRRVLYVAMTRAKSKLFLPLFSKNSQSQFLVDLLWNSVEGFQPTEFLMDPKNAPFMTLTPVDSIKPTTLAAEIVSKPLLLKRPFPYPAPQTRVRPWTSFSTLTREPPPKKSLEPKDLLPGLDEMGGTIPDDNFPLELYQDLPKGNHTGNLLHHVLETLPFEWLHLHRSLETFEMKEKEYSKFNAFLQRALRLHALPIQYLPALRKIIWNTLKTMLPAPNSFTLASLTHRNHEMEFLLAIKPQLKALLSLDLDEHPRLEFRFDLDAYYLRGFVDLVFEWEGKYFIADWKSNHLGNSCEEYTPTRIYESIRDQNYFLQYSLYIIALCLFLKKQNPGFTYENDFGGVYYFYLRGMQENKSTGLFFHKPTRQQLLNFAEPFLIQGSEF